MSSPADTFAPLSPSLTKARTRTNTTLSHHSSTTTSRQGSDNVPKPVIDTNLLPKSTSSTLRLTQCTPAEVLQAQRNNSVAWRGNLSTDQYLRRESILANQDMTRNGGITFWMLTDDQLPQVENEQPHQQQQQQEQEQQQPLQPTPERPKPKESSNERVVLSACETFRKRALIRRKGDETGKIDEIICHSVGSVFCPAAFRGRGYAGVMMSKLSQQLAQHQHRPRRRDGRELDVGFSTLYSDIGPDFYKQNGGWEPFESRQLSLPAVPPSSDIIENASAVFPLTRRLKTEDLPSLCIADETLMRQRLERIDAPEKNVVAIIPDIQTIMWMHAREDFVCQEIFTRYPEIKGAIVSLGEGKHAWCYWVRMYYNEEIGSMEGNNLYMLRIAIEPGLEGSVEGEVACAALLQAAQREAHGWHMSSVVVWNPNQVVQNAAARALGKKPGEVEVVDREKESICALRWYGDGGEPGTARESVQWVANEKFGWC